MSNNLDYATSYHPGDTLTIGGGTSGTTNIDYLVCDGLLTTSRCEMVFSVTLPHSLKNISTVTLNASKVYIRHVNGGYILQGADLVAQATTILVGIVSENTVTISASKTTNWVTQDVAPNNTPVSIEGGFVLSFS
ncbi:hypothetical protein IKG38_03510 [Candidatus Saccharibacteria bacterium]|nr:hypothetical protein [Candidatus Saccharibacteria bacterium]